MKTHMTRMLNSRPAILLISIFLLCLAALSSCSPPVLSADLYIDSFSMLAQEDGLVAISATIRAFLSISPEDDAGADLGSLALSLRILSVSGSAKTLKVESSYTINQALESIEFNHLSAAGEEWPLGEYLLELVSVDDSGPIYLSRSFVYSGVQP